MSQLSNVNNTLNGGTGGVSKVTPQASIIINSAADSYTMVQRSRGHSKHTLYSNIQEDNFAVMRGELVFMDKDKPLAGMAMGKNNPSVTVLSALNGMDAGASAYQMYNASTASKSQKQAALREIAKKIKFVGIAQGEKSKRDYENRSLALAIRVAGSDTIYNSGHSTIHPGDDVMWDVPDPGVAYNIRAGTPKTKNILVVKKYDYTESQLKEDIYLIGESETVARDSDESLVKGAIEAFLDKLDITDTHSHKKNIFTKGNPVNEAFCNMIKYMMMYKASNYDSRVIGKALSHGEAGKSFDILLNHTHVSS